MLYFWYHKTVWNFTMKCMYERSKYLYNAYIIKECDKKCFKLKNCRKPRWVVLKKFWRVLCTLSPEKLNSVVPPHMSSPEASLCSLQPVNKQNKISKVLQTLPPPWVTRTLYKELYTVQVTQDGSNKLLQNKVL
jgi:hypothetical protein